MSDTVDTITRSRIMSRIRAANTKPELVVRSGLWHRGFRFRTHVRSLPGSPDLVLPKWRTVIFVHGCFWHAHQNCRFFRLPGTRPEFWAAKLNANAKRDAADRARLEAAGWRVLTIWECAIRSHPAEAIAVVTKLIHECGAIDLELREDGKSGELAVVLP